MSGRPRPKTARGAAPLPPTLRPVHGADRGSREEILEAVAFTSEVFLGVGAWEECLSAVLARLGEATGVSRVYVFPNRRTEAGELGYRLLHEWAAPGIAPTDPVRAGREFTYAPAFMRWQEALGAGDVICGNVCGFPESERAVLLDIERIVSIAVVPILVDGAWWGFLGFDDCVAERDWSSGELDALRAASAVLGSAIGRRESDRARDEVQEQMREERAKHRALVEQIPAIVYLAEYGGSGEWLYISPQIEEMLGYTPEEWLAHPEPFAANVHPDDLPRALAEEEASWATGDPLNSEYRIYTRDRRLLWIRDQASLVRTEDGRPLYWQGLMHDVTEQKVAEERAAFLAYHDKLTDLPNRVMFEELLELSLDRARRHDLAVGALVLDLDDFKLVNDSLGHAAGDELLRQLAGRLREASRETDLVARQGGDEFLLLLADLELQGHGTQDLLDVLVTVEAVATRIQEALREPFALADTEVYVTASIGMAAFPFHADDAKVLLKNADTAMYQSKRAGPGGHVVFSEGGGDALTRLSLVTRLRKAVEQQDWTLHYQPIVHLSTGHMIGAEALIRWPDEQGGMIPPMEFIPVAEEMGLIREIGDWVISEMCRQAREWEDDGMELEVSFNVSPQQVWDPDFVDSVMRRLEWAEVDPRRVVVEITESTAMSDPERLHGVSEALRARDLRLAIDDFGTGYSSLSRLKELPVDILKIDRSFIADVPGDRHAANLVRAVIQLAEGLDMVPLAEGVETDAQRRFLVDQGCAVGQGFYFSRPVPPADLEKHYRGTRAAGA